ncbi:MAG: hypothetical protein R6W96_08755 [Clostridia bacterium]
MKVLMRSVDMICVNTREGVITPVKFRMTDSRGDTHIVRVQKVLDQKEEKLAGNRMIVFRVQSQVFNQERVYEMKYEISTCKWFIYKM